MPTPRAAETRIPSKTFDRVAKGERVRVRRRGEPSVYLISEEDLKLLEEMEDRLDAEAGLKALKAFRKSGKKSIPWEQVKKEAGL